MIKKVLSMIDKGYTLFEISQTLEIEYSALIAMCEHMRKMGYLEEVKTQPGNLCNTCPLQKICAKRNYRIFALADKGKKLISH